RGERYAYFHVPMHMEKQVKFERDHFRPGGEDIVLDLKFAPATKVTGRFLDDTERPIAGLKITLAGCEFIDRAKRERSNFSPEFHVSDKLMKLAQNQFQATTDSEGRFAFDSVPPATFCFLRINDPKYGYMMICTATSETPPERFDERTPVLRQPTDIRLR